MELDGWNSTCTCVRNQISTSAIGVEMKVMNTKDHQNCKNVKLFQNKKTRRTFKTS